MVTIKDIARISGYGISTVSRALNNQPDVSPVARKKIQEVVKHLGYVPNSNAKLLKQSGSNCIGIVVKGTLNTLFSSIIEQMQLMIKQAGYTGVIIYLDEVSVNEVEQGVQFCIERKPRGIVFLGGNRDNFLRSFDNMNVPCVLATACAKNLNFPLLSSVTTDDRKAAANAVEYLIEAGHEKIGVVGGAVNHSDISQLRYSGCLDSFLKHNIQFDIDSCYEQARYSYGSAYNAMERLIEKNPHLTAVFTMSDVMAIGAIRCLQDKGYSVPNDISVMGFDGIELAEYFNPKITTVKQSQSELAYHSMQLLFGAIEEKKQGEHRTTPFKIIEGESVKKRNK